MSQQHFSAPPSEIAKESSRYGDEIPQRKQTREEYRKLKELEELRKAGSAPAAVDEQGHDINPHIPQYMVDVPWYVSYDHSRPTLKHQRNHPEKIAKYDGIRNWYKRADETIQDKDEIVIRFKPGSCENCGSTSHKRKECLERPRKIGAKYGGGPIRPADCKQPNLNLNWEGKRDRWNGVDVSVHQNVVLAEFSKLEELKKRMKDLGEIVASNSQGAEDLPIENTDNHNDDDGEEDEERYAEEMDMPGQKVDSKQRISVRNLRIREDTAKYLLNLDPESAYYDPKSRSMRGDPLLGKRSTSDHVNTLFTGDNYVRTSGDAKNFVQSQLFAWESHEKGIVVHQQADPTKLQLLHKQFRVKKAEYMSDMKRSILNTYGGEEHLQERPVEVSESVFCSIPSEVDDPVSLKISKLAK
ncbi:hypothetical protein GJ496_009030 [Pomphorhynchus laevis]|nr:hypothetical protein GJ496_009030 [Pomphorhynchus laevis]